MKRKNKENPTAILSADWHIRDDRPVCRTDNFIEAMLLKLGFIQGLASKYNCPVLIAGDLGHKPMWGDKLLNLIIHYLSLTDTQYIIIPGQHDLPNHRLDKWKDAGIGVLDKSIKNFEVAEYEGGNGTSKAAQLAAFPYSTKIKSYKKKSKRLVALTHQMVIQSQKKKLWYDQVANHGKRLLKKYPCYDLIVSGDNHQSFVVEHAGRVLVNPGSIMRMTANQINHKPSVYLWYAESNTVERVYLPIEQNVINREHIDIISKRNDRIDSFVNKLKDTGEVGLSFENNMKSFLQTNKIKKKIKEKIWESLL